jgi:hypothetical protein
MTGASRWDLGRQALVQVERVWMARPACHRTLELRTMQKIAQGIALGLSALLLIAAAPSVAQDARPGNTTTEANAPVPRGHHQIAQLRARAAQLRIYRAAHEASPAALQSWRENPSLMDSSWRLWPSLVDF